MAASDNSPTSYWLDFFQSAGIPSKISLRYAKLFVDHRIQKWQLADLNKGLLNEIGITAIGDALAILRFAKQELERTSYENLEFVRHEKSPITPKSNLKRTSEGIFARSAGTENTQIEKRSTRNTTDFDIPVKRPKILEGSNFSRTVRVSTEKKPSVMDRLGAVTVTLRKSGGRVKFSPQTKEEEVTSTTSGFTALESDKILKNLAKESVNDRLGAKRRSPTTIIIGGTKRLVLSAASAKNTSAKVDKHNFKDSPTIKSRLGPKATSIQPGITTGSGIFDRLGKKA